MQSQPTALDLTLIQDFQSFSWGSLSFLPQLSSDIGGGLYGPLLHELGDEAARESEPGAYGHHGDFGLPDVET